MWFSVTGFPVTGFPITRFWTKWFSLTCFPLTRFTLKWFSLTRFHIKWMFKNILKKPGAYKLDFISKHYFFQSRLSIKDNNWSNLFVFTSKQIKLCHNKWVGITRESEIFCTFCLSQLWFSVSKLRQLTVVHRKKNWCNFCSN